MRKHIYFEITLEVYGLRSVFELLKLLELKVVHLRCAKKKFSGQLEYPKRLAVSKMKLSQLGYLRKNIGRHGIECAGTIVRK